MTVAPISLKAIKAEIAQAAPNSRQHVAYTLYLEYLQEVKWELEVHSAPGADCFVNRRALYVEGQCCDAKRQHMRRFAEWEKRATAFWAGNEDAPVNSQNWWNHIGIRFDMLAKIVD
jgi:hypothetical protein